MRQSSFTTSDGAHIYYEDRGAGDPLLFVPGHMCTTRFFEKNASHFERTHRVICMDSRGFGRSSKPLHGNSVARHAEDIHELICHLELDNVTLLGWSLSGSVIVTYTHRYGAHRLRALGLIDCALYPFSQEPWNDYRPNSMDGWNRKYIPWYTDNLRYIDNFVQRVSEHLTPEEVDLVRQEIAATPPWIGFALHSDWCYTDAASLLPKVTVPVILFTGQSASQGHSQGRHYQSLLNVYSEHHQFDLGGHMPFFIESEKFNTLLEHFLCKVISIS